MTTPTPGAVAAILSRDGIDRLIVRLAHRGIHGVPRNNHMQHWGDCAE